jgi:hypothetical protein
MYTFIHQQHDGTNRATAPLVTLQADAKRHNVQLRMVNWWGFVIPPSKRLLDSLPSTAEEDGVLLEQILGYQQQQSPDDPDDDRLHIMMIGERHCLPDALQENQTGLQLMASGSVDMTKTSAATQ